MYGKWVTLFLGEDIECKVWVACTPTTSDDVLNRLAINTLRSRIPQKKRGIAAGMEAISIISDYEYSQGYGTRYDLEQSLKKLLKEIDDNVESETV